MKWVALAIALIIQPALAADDGPSTGANHCTNCIIVAPIGSNQKITLAGSTGLTVPTGANCATITVDAGTANVRWRDDGVAPTSTTGIELVSGSTLPYCGSLSVIRFIQESGSPVLNIAYYK